jgi:hypothetical protein
MTGLTIPEMMKELGLKRKTVESRLRAAKIEPRTKDAIYPEDTLEKIRNPPPRGRPPKPKP